MQWNTKNRHRADCLISLFITYWKYRFDWANRTQPIQIYHNLNRYSLLNHIWICCFPIHNFILSNIPRYGQRISGERSLVPRPDLNETMYTIDICYRYFIWNSQRPVPVCAEFVCQRVPKKVRRYTLYSLKPLVQTLSHWVSSKYCFQ